MISVMGVFLTLCALRQGVLRRGHGCGGKTGRGAIFVARIGLPWSLLASGNFRQEGGS
jgi:hypothetical protein